LDTNHLVEFSDGRIEVLPMPSDRHQAIAAFIFMAFVAFTKKFGGTVRFAPLRVRLWPGKVREPDVVFLLAEHDARRHEEYWEGADVVVEVVSGSSQDRRRDLVTKRQEYAQAGISEYWIVDPDRATITVLTLVGSEYGEHGRFTRNEVATSSHLPGFWVAVNEALDAI
jgi:Uma2 family endonuclease